MRDLVRGAAITFFLCLLLLVGCLFPRDYELSFIEFGYRVPIDINNTSQEIFTDFPVLVVLNPARADPDNLAGGFQFYGEDGQTPLAHEVDYLDPGGSSWIWVKIPSIPAAQVTRFWLYSDLRHGSTQTYEPSEVWSSGFAGVWHLNDSVEPAPDSCGSTPARTNVVGLTPPDPVPGRVAGGMSCVEASDGFTAACTIMEADFGPVTISFWANMEPSADSDFDQVLHKGPFRVYLYGGDASTAHFIVLIKCADPAIFSDDILVEYKSLPKDGLWHWYTITWDGITGPGSAGRVQLYRDGVAVSVERGMEQDGDFPYLGDLESDLFIGNSSGVENSFTAGFDELRVSRTVRAAEWIHAQYLSMNDAGYLSYGPEEPVPDPDPPPF